VSDLPAGNFSEWLRNMRSALAGDGGMDVACGDCVGCCTSSYYIKVRSKESRALAAIDPRHLDPEPTAAGDRIMGFDSNGHCHLFANGGCSIYADRPDTCRTYDCRVFAAVGMPAGGDDKAVINERVARWRFDYPSESDRREQGAVRAAADYLRQHPVRFPNGRVPSRPSDIAVLAVKTYRVFLDPPANDPDIARAIVEANREFARS
jgi:Fe-S-cluster containining protein